MDKIRALLRLKKKNNTVVVSRVSDLLKKGVDPENIIREFIRINHDVWDNITDSDYIWTEEMLRSQFGICPDLIYCAFEKGEMVGTASGFFTNEEDLRKHKTWLEKTVNGYFTNHAPDGEIAFGADLSVIRTASPRTADKLILSSLFCTILSSGVKYLYLGARIPGYHRHSEMEVKDYVFGKRKNGKPYDPELYFYLKNGFEIMEIIPEYMDDPESLNYGVLIKWENPFCRMTKIFPFLKPVIMFIGKTLFLRTPENI